MNNIKQEPCDRFSDKVWLFIEKSLSDKDMLFWEKHLENCEVCTILLNESLEVTNIYENIPVEDMPDRDFQRMINNAIQSEIVIDNSRKTMKIPERRSLLDIIGIYRLTFGGAIVVGAIVFLLITFLNNPKIPEINKGISSHLLSWDNENVSEQLSNIEDQIISLKTDDWDIYLVKKNRKEKWDNEVRSIQKQIRKMRKQADSPAM
ncbi:zf-HC2 domain-containing protein [bacterium BMS3Abin03]|jgi:hypothetical protein|nr:zf-HC2 domain-containing protein [bacterium BMS3Abin03]MCG6960736.1 zf-HC2 domain-containing protein [bacterium BMS3Abin03]